MSTEGKAVCKCEVRFLHVKTREVGWRRGKKVAISGKKLPYKSAMKKRKGDSEQKEQAGG